ncbi:hypothetical protein FDUTEX481_05835 [Tolypothrix sp. PCC 7601]|nr:hypothetical protein FDUTEX481_05835 [Tolypothrix sp. PCC 7601]
MKQPQNIGIASLHSVSLAMTAFGSIILWSSLYRRLSAVHFIKSNASF